jgi:hypothetical protein
MINNIHMIIIIIFVDFEPFRRLWYTFVDFGTLS